MSENLTEEPSPCHLIFMALAVIGIIIVKVYEMKRDQDRIARGEEPLSKDPPVIDVIDWTRRK